MKIKNYLLLVVAFMFVLLGVLAPIPNIVTLGKETNYCEIYNDGGGGAQEITRETFYDTYEMKDNHIKKLMPSLSSVNFANNCAGVAGTTIVAAAAQRHTETSRIVPL